MKIRNYFAKKTEVFYNSNLYEADYNNILCIRYS